VSPISVPRGFPAAVAAVVAAAVAAAPARAVVAPITAGPGEHPTVAVDAAGTGYVAWNQRTGPNANVVRVCKVPRGASACTPLATFAPEGEDILGHPFVFTGPNNALAVISNRCCFSEQPGSRTYLFTSPDGGATWSSPLLIGTLSPSGDAALGPDGAIDVVTDVTTGGIVFQHAPPATPPTTAEALVGPQYEYGGTIAFDGAIPIVAYFDIDGTGASHVAFTRWSGGGDINDAATWSPPALIEPGDSTRLAGGPSGVFLMDQVGEPGQRQYLVRKLASGTASFGAPVKVGPAENGYMNHLAEDGGGMLHAVWRRNGAPATLRYATAPGGANWNPPVDLVRDDNIFNLRAAAAPDHRGWVVYDQNNSEGQVRVAPLEYPTVQNRSVTVGSDVITLQTPQGCLSRSTLVARLFVRSKKPKGHVVVKVGRVNFLVDGRVRVQDKRAPFRATIVLRGLRRGSTHQLRAKVFLRVHHGPRRSRSVRNTFQICP
jgi:hypothetical protein